MLPTRRGILQRLGRSAAAISELAEAFDMTLTGVKKHVQVLEADGLVTTEKVGRIRHCRLGPATWPSGGAPTAAGSRSSGWRCGAAVTLVAVLLCHTTDERDGMLHSGMEGGLNRQYEAMDRLLVEMQ